MPKLPMPLRVLFVCTHNRCRSILAEALLRSRGGDRFVVRSAGSEPANAVHPLTLNFLQSQQLPITDLFSKSWNELGDFIPDLVITVCNRAASESCPLWPGHAIKAHWGVADPTAITGDDSDIQQAFANTFAQLQQRVDQLRALPLHNMTAAALQARLEQMALTSRGGDYM